MVAQTIQLPNVRKLFLPDPGKVLVEVDLARADAQVVAWEADDETLKELFRANADIHTANALAIFGGPGPIDKGLPGYAAWDFKRQKAKVGVHAVNYGCKAKTLSEHLNCSVAQAEDFINRWFSAHPKVLAWQRRVETDISLRGCVENKWGYKYHFFDRVDKLLPEALAWIGQSTVAITINQALVKIDELLPQVEILYQVHDSILMQLPEASAPSLIPHILDLCHVPIPYADPLIIPPTLQWSAKSWGDLKKWEPANAKIG